MCELVIQLRTIDKIRKFIDDIEPIVGRISFRVGRILVDARSIMTVFTMDLSKDIDVVYEGDDIDKFYETMDNFRE